MRNVSSRPSNLSRRKKSREKLKSWRTYEGAQMWSLFTEWWRIPSVEPRLSSSSMSTTQTSSSCIRCEACGSVLRFNFYFSARHWLTTISGDICTSCWGPWTTATAWALCTGTWSHTTWWSTTRTGDWDWSTGAWRSSTILARSTTSGWPADISRSVQFFSPSVPLSLSVTPLWRSGSRAAGGLSDVWLQSGHVESWLYVGFDDL